MSKSYSNRLMIFISIILLGIGIIMLTSKSSDKFSAIFLIILSITMIFIGFGKKQ